MQITVYGTGTSGHQYVVHSLKSILDRAAIEYSLREVSDVNVFLDKEIESVPAVQLDDEPIINIRNNNSFGQSLRNILHRTLEKKNFGLLPKIFIPFNFNENCTNTLVYGHRLATELKAVVQVSTVCNGSFDLEALDSCSYKLEDIAKILEHDQGGDILKSALVKSSILYGDDHQAIMDEIAETNPSFIILPLKDYSFLEEDDDSLFHVIKAKFNIPIILVPPKATFKRIRNVFCFCKDSSCFEAQKNYFLRFSSLFNSSFSVYVGCPENNNSDELQNLENVFMREKMDFLDTNDIQSFDKFQRQLTESKTDFLFISKFHCALKHYYRNSKEEFIEVMQDKPILFF